MIEMLVSQHDELIQTFLLDRLDYPRDVGVQVRRPDLVADPRYARSSQSLSEFRSELRIAFVLDDPHPKAAISSLLNEPPA
jgi:hypothetical protein